jgi:hypothetical protein
MADEIVETSSQGWLSRLFESIKQVLVGLLLFVVSFPVLWWNEGRAVQTYKSLKEGAGAVVSVPADRVDAANESRLVHVGGKAVTTVTLTDPAFNVRATALRLERKVEIYQWVEKTETKKQKKLGGGEETVKTTRYVKEWSDDLADSSQFKDATGHQNPSSVAYRSESFRASPVTLGAFTLSDALVDRIGGAQKLVVTEDMLGSAVAAAAPAPEAPAKAVSPKVKKSARTAKAQHTAKARHAATPAPAGPKRQVVDGGIYLGADPQTPEVGDLRVSFVQVPPSEVSIIAAQVGSSFGEYQTHAGDSLELLQAGIVPAAAMFKQAEAENAMLTWILRLVGFLAMLAGVFLFFKPIAVVADVLPFLGDILRVGIGALALAVALPLSLVTIALAWVYYRPLVGIPLLVTGIGAFVLVKIFAAKRKAASAPAPQPAG